MLHQVSFPITTAQGLRCQWAQDQTLLPDRFVNGHQLNWELTNQSSNGTGKKKKKQWEACSIWPACSAGLHCRERTAEQGNFESMLNLGARHAVPESGHIWHSVTCTSCIWFLCEASFPTEETIKRMGWQKCARKLQPSLLAPPGAQTLQHIVERVKPSLFPAPG